ncbi:MAG: phosphate ABC transporter substrate-binding/OmpA family protein [Pseudomonadota bacterium]
MRDAVAIGLLAIIGLWSTSLKAELSAAPVELYALDGSVVVKGALLEVSHGSYVVQTALGTLRIGLDEAQCVGTACPLLDRFDADFSIASSTPDLNEAMSGILARYADALEADYRISEIDALSSEVSIIESGTSERLASVRIGVRGSDEGTVSQDDAQSDGSGQNGARGEGLSVFAESNEIARAGYDDLLTLGLEGVAIITHPDSPLAMLSRTELAEVFACKETASLEVKSLAGPLRVYSRTASSDTYQAFKATVLDPLNLGLCDQVIQLPSDSDIAAAVARDVNAIGAINLRHQHEAKPLAIAECGLVHQPYLFGAKTEEYPLTRRILLDAPLLTDSSAAAQTFIDFTLGDIGQRHLETVGLIGLDPMSTSAYASRYRVSRIEAAAGAVQNTEIFGRLLVALEDAVRLSVTFRFSTGGASVDGQTGLDNRAQRDLIRLADYLRTTAPDGTEVLLFGFADAAGDYDGNLSLSLQRARSVADKLESLGVKPSFVAGFGEEGPVACNSDANGRAKNRRVEVWLRLPDASNDQRMINITM